MKENLITIKESIKIVITNIEKYFTIFFFCISIFVIFLLTQTLILTWIGQFKLLYISFSALTLFLLTIFFFFFIKKDMETLPHLNILPLIIILFACLIFIFFPHDTFGGRDEGLFANLSVYLTNHGNLKIPLYLYANPADTKPLIGRLPAYTTWLAIQNMFFGQNWMLRSDVILVALGLICLYLVASFFGGKKIGLITLILYTSCLSFLWLGRETLSENLAFFLLWFLVLLLILFFKTKRNIYLGSLFITSWLFSFTRIEGQFIQIPILLVLISITLITKTTSIKKTFFITLIYILFIASTFLIYNNIANKKYLEANVSSAISVAKTSLSSISIEQNNYLRLIDRLPTFFMQMLIKYNLLFILFSIILATIIIINNKKNSLKNKIYFIGLLIIISPEFIKLINPGISVDQPWLFRRYLYALIPFGYLCLSILLNKIMKRKLLAIIISALFIINIAFSSKIITLKNNWSITKELEKITMNVTTNDVIMIKSYSFLDNYIPVAYLNYQKEIRSLYSDWMEVESNRWLPKEKIFQGIPYKRLYLLSDKESESYKDFKLIKINSVNVKYKQLQYICDLSLLQKDLEFTSYGYLYLPYKDVISYCSKTDNEILNVKKKIFLYELIFLR